ncbi:MAG: isochorismatase family protein [Alphaproteobacteria bacterium]|nr:MAG: isochorismatase family protein [Alphaproteobacteria bacterium]
MAGRDAGDLDDDYGKAGFGNRLGFGRRPALVIVDVVMAYLDPASPLYAGVEDELTSNERLLAAARQAHVPVVFTNVEYTPGGIDGGHFYRKVEALRVFDRGGPLGAFPPSLQPLDNEVVITKQYPSAFFGTSLASSLTAWGRDCVIVTGYTTSGCVRATALDALQYGFLPVVVRDACGDRDTRVQEANLFDLGAKYADVVREQEVLDYFRSL